MPDIRIYLARIFKIKHLKIDWEFYAESAINQHMPQAEKAN